MPAEAGDARLFFRLKAVTAFAVPFHRLNWIAFLAASSLWLRAGEPPPTIKFSLPPPPPPAPAEPESTADGPPPAPGEGTQPAPPAAEAASSPAASSTPPATETARPVETPLELQVELHRRGFSCGSIDGVTGAQTVGALKAFQRNAGIAETGVIDDATRGVLLLTAPALKEYVISADDLDGLKPVPDTWLGKSQADALGYATALEEVAERFRANPKFLQQINPDVDWANITAGVHLQVPAVERPPVTKTAARILIALEARELEVVDDGGAVLAHFPVSIARMVEKRPVGELHVKVIIPDPNYTFDPAVFPESDEGRELGRKLVVPPGPNNPVGVAWIGLDLPGYGIHGTPEPEKVGRTESHGCFRLANWDARTLLNLVRVGLPVVVEP